MTPGLANRLSFRSASKICCNFPETLKHLPSGKAVLTGSPIRSELLSGSSEKGRELTGFDSTLPVLLIIGGSLGSLTVNKAVRECLTELTQEFNIIHLCGKGNIDKSLADTDGYIQFEYADKELKDLFALSDIIISRAGANSICEILALKKPNILIPLPAAASRGDQILNADSFKAQGFSCVIKEEKLTKELLLKSIRETYASRRSYIDTMSKSSQSNGVEAVIGIIEGYMKR